MDPKALERLLTQLGDGTHYMSAAEYCGYLHTKIAKTEVTNHSLCLTVDFDSHYCQYFDSHESKWTIHLSDHIKSQFEDAVPEKRTIVIPKGLGQHTICIGPDL
jgi:hypothetical protein